MNSVRKHHKKDGTHRHRRGHSASSLTSSTSSSSSLSPTTEKVKSPITPPNISTGSHRNKLLLGPKFLDAFTNKNYKHKTIRKHSTSNGKSDLGSSVSTSKMIPKSPPVKVVIPPSNISGRLLPRIETFKKRNVLLTNANAMGAIGGAGERKIEFRKTFSSELDRPVFSERLEHKTILNCGDIASMMKRPFIRTNLEINANRGKEGK